MENIVSININASSNNTNIIGWTRSLADPFLFEFTDKSPNHVTQTSKNILSKIRLTYIQIKSSNKKLSIIATKNSNSILLFCIPKPLKSIIKYFRKGKLDKTHLLIISLGTINQKIAVNYIESINTDILKINIDNHFKSPSQIEKIINNINSKINHKETESLIKNLKKKFSEYEYRQLEKKISLATTPIIITAHGYKLGLENFTESNLIAQLSSIINTINNFGFKCFINSGTLLGYVRSGELIPHDDDIDVGVFLGSTNENLASKKWINLIKLIEKEFKIHKNGNEIITVVLNEGVGVDIFPSWSVNGNLYIYPYLHGELEYSVLLPIKNIVWHGCTIGIPNNPARLLTINYGDNWNIPNKSWRFDWKTASKEFKSFIEVNQKNSVKFDD